MKTVLLNDLESHNLTLTEVVISLWFRIAHSGSCWLRVALRTLSGVSLK